MEWPPPAVFQRLHFPVGISGAVSRIAGSVPTGQFPDRKQTSAETAHDAGADPGGREAVPATGGVLAHGFCTRRAVRLNLGSPIRRAPKGRRAWSHHSFLGWIGAAERIRTSDLLITNQLLYQLSYCGTPRFGRSRVRRHGES